MFHKISKDNEIIVYGTGFEGKILANWIELFTEGKVVTFVVSDGYRKFDSYRFPK